MNNNIYFVVGDIFKNLSDQRKVIGFSELIEKICKKEIKQGYLSLEQGISEEQVILIKELISKHNLNHTVDVYSYFDEAPRCARKFTHKEQEFNTLISEPNYLGDKHYASLLMIDGRCAEVSDHITGKHIQMMVLMEAARQMVLAVTEKFFIADNLRDKMSFVANRIESTFNEYIFPFRTELHYEILKQKILVGNNLVNQAKISFVQNKRIVASLEFDSTVLSKIFLTDKESRLSDICIANYQQSFMRNRESKLLKVVNVG